MSKSNVFKTIASVVITSTVLISLEGLARGGDSTGHRHPEQARMTLLERLDSNADGVLSADEFSDRNAEKALRHFSQKDSNGDETLSQEEFSSPGKHRRHPGQDGLDTDVLDACVNDALGYELPERPDSATAFSTADINSDGSVDLDEFLVAGDLRAEQRFADIDNDGDAQITSDEIDIYQAIRQQQRAAHRLCVGELLDEEELLN